MYFFPYFVRLSEVLYLLPLTHVVCNERPEKDYVMFRIQLHPHSYTLRGGAIHIYLLHIAKEIRSVIEPIAWVSLEIPMY